MKLRIYWAALCCLLLPLPAHAALFGVFAQTPVPGPISLSAATVSPSTLSGLVKGSYLYLPPSGPGAQVATFTISAGSWSATLHAYTVGVDGATLSLADNAVYNRAAGTFGPVGSGSSGTYDVSIPSGGFCLVQTSVSTAPTCTGVISPGAANPVQQIYNPFADPGNDFTNNRELVNLIPAAVSSYCYSVDPQIGISYHESKSTAGNVLGFVAANGTNTVEYIQVWNGTPGSGIMLWSEPVNPITGTAGASYNTVRRGQDIFGTSGLFAGTDIYIAWSSTWAAYTAVGSATNLGFIGLYY